MSAARNALNGPAHVIMPKQGAAQFAAGAVPPDVAPSLILMGNGIQDHRLQWNYANGNGDGVGVLGFYGSSKPRTLNVVPATAGAASVAAAAHVVANTPMTLVAASGGGVTVLAEDTLVYPSLTTIPAGALAVGPGPDVITFGSGFVSGFYDVTTMLARGISITGVAAGAGGNFLVEGWDIYGYPMSQQITVAAGVNTVDSLKAFGFIGSVTPLFTDAQNYSVGTADLIGFNLYTSAFQDVSISYNSAAITAATGYTAGVTTSPSTKLLGDVRGTYALQSASDGTKRLIIEQLPVLAAMATNPTTGLFGQPQV